MPKKKTASHYVRQRQDFFQQHPNSKVLIGLLIIAFSVYVAVQFQNIQKQQYIMLQLLEEGIDPSYADL